MPELDGRIALITGASRGIGRATALELAAAGAAIGVNYRSDEAGAAAVVGEIEAAGGRALALQADVANPEEAAALVARCEDELGELDALVCNAGITRDNLIARITPEDFDAVIATNLGGTFHVCQAAARRMLRRRRGSIVTMSSIVGIHGNAGQTNYSASKAGLDRPHEVAGQGDRLARRARQLHRAGLHLDRADGRAAGERTRGAARLDAARAAG